MRTLRTSWLIPAGLLVAVFAAAQTPSQPNATPPASKKHSTATLKRSPVTARRRTLRTKSSGITTIPLESAPPTLVTAASLAAQQRQKAADQSLLESQQAQSNRAAQITNQTVEQATKQRESVQQEQRIQDAPGPVQTGIVPAAGPPVRPTDTDTRIQDAPGPAQTVPAQTVPAQTIPAQPSTQPPAPSTAPPLPLPLP